MALSVLRSTLVTVSDEELAAWQRGAGVGFQVAVFLAKHLPRGKGWFPRLIGRRLFPGMRTTIRTARGALLAVDPGDLDYYTSIALHGGELDPEIGEACRALLDRGEVFYDIGAHGGLFSAEVAVAFGGQIRVVAFEPQEHLAKVAAVSGRLNRFQAWEVHRLLLGSSRGNACLYVPTSGYHASLVSREACATELECPMETLDALMDTGWAPPSLMKLDVEGAEREVVRGGQHLIATCQPVIIFESDANMARFGYTRRELVDDLRSLADYRFFYVGQRGLVPAGGNHVDDAPYSNVAAVPLGRLSRAMSARWTSQTRGRHIAGQTIQRRRRFNDEARKTSAEGGESCS